MEICHSLENLQNWSQTKWEVYGRTGYKETSYVWKVADFDNELDAIYTMNKLNAWCISRNLDPAGYKLQKRVDQNNDLDSNFVFMPPGVEYNYRELVNG